MPEKRVLSCFLSPSSYKHESEQEQNTNDLSTASCLNSSSLSELYSNSVLDFNKTKHKNPMPLEHRFMCLSAHTT